ncbi:MAG TPA: undecaprenyldiphospho-muramoylpentapeptide beta-N-acetylglucosaminyltransferase [Solirubrobacteraceae bacterium]|nr:undecaprenyldiphospho-muramoylpentapeptide beta-N-acetylglucosaminyltransferase [Solirubrobacteraceae bacterium]
MSATPPKIAIAAGGTAGHVVPALAVADALRARGAEVTFIGGERAEAELVPAAGYSFHRIAVAGLDRRNPLRAARAALLAVRALVRARALLGRLRPDAVMGGGGYVSGPVGLAAIVRGIPLVLTEADSHLGIANRALAPLARRVCLAFPIDGRNGSRYRVTGRPIPPPYEDRAEARRRLGIATGETCVLVFGGSLGARSINLAALDAYAGAAFHVVHVCGRRDHPELSARPLPQGYDLRDYMDLGEFAQALAAADLVVARAGGSLFEVVAHGTPAILVPYAHATADHQAANARWMERGGAAVVVPDAELSAARLARETAALLADPQRLRAMAAAARRLARPDAADAVADELLQAARG